jgi:hypothetical protein
MPSVSLASFLSVDRKVPRQNNHGCPAYRRIQKYIKENPVKWKEDH